jgi:hydroxymethylpyrimidine/phosphomethylpyrimidine kinase
VQADLKTFAALQVYGLSVLSGVTAQNTLAVTASACLPPDLVTAQLQAVFEDMKIAAIKIGLLGDAANTGRVASFLADICPATPLVLDPVMVSTSGHTFLAPAAISALKEIMPLATVITPNLPEAEALSGLAIRRPEDRRAAAERLREAGARRVLIKGGHGQGPEADDYLLGPEGETWFKGPRVETLNTHGTGCTLSAAICANLALGLELPQAIGQAKSYVTQGLRQSLRLGRGPGPLNHFHPYYHLES